MRKHIFTLYHILSTLKTSKYADYFIAKLFKSDKICINDIGCGPITGAIAYSLFCQQTENKIPEISYIGIDKSKSMLEQSMLFLKSKIIFFNPSSVFNFGNDWDQLPRKGFNFHEFYMGEKPTETFFAQLHLFSYLFANLNEKETISLAKNIDEYFTGWSDRELIVIFQNSTDVSKNKMYELFKLKSNVFRLVYSGNDTIKYHNNRRNADKFNPSEEMVCYEILVNRTAYENMLNHQNEPIKYKSNLTNNNDNLPF